MIEELFSIIEEQAGVRGRWMRRRDDPATYMEVYEGVADDTYAAMRRSFSKGEFFNEHIRDRYPFRREDA